MMNLYYKNVDVSLINTLNLAYHNHIADLC